MSSPVFRQCCSSIHLSIYSSFLWSALVGWFWTFFWFAGCSVCCFDITESLDNQIYATQTIR